MSSSQDLGRAPLCRQVACVDHRASLGTRSARLQCQCAGRLAREVSPAARRPPARLSAPPRPLQCDCCLDLGTHVGCHERATGQALPQAELESQSFIWYCSEVRGRAQALVPAGASCRSPTAERVQLPRGRITLAGEGAAEDAQTVLFLCYCHRHCSQDCLHVSKGLWGLTGVLLT